MKPRAAVFFLFTAYSVMCAAQARNTSSRIFNRNKDSVVIVMAGKDGDKSSLEGSGFVIAKDQVVTNFHVVRDSDVAVVEGFDPETTDRLLEGALKAKKTEMTRPPALVENDRPTERTR